MLVNIEQGTPNVDLRSIPHFEKHSSLFLNQCSLFDIS